MSATAAINEQLLRENITRAINDVFSTMLGREPTFMGCTNILPDDGMSPPASGPASGNTTFVVGTVGFVGDINGLIYLYLDETLARHSTCHLLGMNEAELEQAGDEVINDAIGEITNMTVGSFKSGLCDAGYMCKLTIPSILRGSNFRIEPTTATTRYLYHYETAGHKVTADILIQTDE